MYPQVTFASSAKMVLASGIAASALTSLVNSGVDNLAGSVASSLIGVGGPTAIGAALANLIFPPKAGGDGGNQLPSYLERALVGGVVAAGVLMAAGQLPVSFDTQTLAFVGLVGSAIAIGDAIVLLQIL